jgi:hypothetical protein
VVVQRELISCFHAALGMIDSLQIILSTSTGFDFSQQALNFLAKLTPDEKFMHSLKQCGFIT